MQVSLDAAWQKIRQKHVAMEIRNRLLEDIRKFKYDVSPKDAFESICESAGSILESMVMAHNGC